MFDIKEDSYERGPYGKKLTPPRQRLSNICINKTFILDPEQQKNPTDEKLTETLERLDDVMKPRDVKDAAADKLGKRFIYNVNVCNGFILVFINRWRHWYHLKCCQLVLF